MTAVMSPPARRYALVVTSHRGDLYLPWTLGLAREMLPWDSFVQRLVIDDAGGAPEGNDYALMRAPQRLGLAEAVRAAWSLVMQSAPTHVFHLEEDFHLTEPVDLDAMADVLDEYGNLAQLTLKRQPWNPQEAAAGGIVEANPDAYVQVDHPHVWTQHRECFSLNPSLIPARVIRGGWPVGNEAEQTARLVGDGAVFGFWGGKWDPPRCIHVGAQGGMGSPGWAA